LKAKLGIFLIVLTALTQGFSLLDKEAGKFFRPKKSEVRFVTLRESQYAGVRAFLPPKGAIGYVTDRRPEELEREYFLIQYALSPLIVLNIDSGVLPEYVVGIFDDPLSAKMKYGGAAKEKNRLVLVGDFGNGIILWRRGGR
jgi:hypothetical protein